MIVACILSFSIGTYIYAIATSKCVRGALFYFSRCTGNATFKRETWERLIGYIECHSRVKQLSKRFYFNKQIQY